MNSCSNVAIAQNGLVQNLFRKRDLLLQHDERHRKIRPLLLILSGGNLGVYGAGAAVALHSLGLSDVFDVVVGVSIGAGIGGYFLAGKRQMLLGSSIFYNEFAGDRFINFVRIRKIVDVGLISDVMRTGRAKMDDEAIRHSRSAFFVGVTDAESGNGALIDAKRVRSGIISAIEASTAVPVGYNPPVWLDGRAFYDGGTGLPFPLRDVVERFDPTDVLVLPNCTFASLSRGWPRIADSLYAALMLRHLTRALRTAIVSRHERLRSSLARAMSGGGDGSARVSILWPPEHGVGTLTRDPYKLRRAVDDSIRRTLVSFGRPDTVYDLL